MLDLALQPAIDDAAMSNSQGEDDETRVLDRVDDPVVPHPDAPQVRVADQWSGAVRAGFSAKTIDRIDDAAGHGFV